jgi:hypothetical protein
MGASCPLTTKNFSVVSAANTTNSSYTLNQLESAGITCSEAYSAAGTNLTLFTNDYTGIFTVGQTDASVDNVAIALPAADAPSNGTSGVSVTSNLLWQCFGISMGSNNIVQESLKVTKVGTQSYRKTGTSSILININDRLLPDTEICSGNSPLTLSLNDGTRFILDSLAKVKLTTCTRNANGSKTVLLELTSGRLTVVAVKPPSTDSIQVKVGNDYLKITDSTTFSVTK